MITATFSLGDTAIHKLSDLFTITHPLEATFQTTALDFTELHIVTDSGNAGTIAVSFNPDINIVAKKYGWLLSSSSPEIVFRYSVGRQRLLSSSIYVVASAITQVFHVTGLV